MRSSLESALNIKMHRGFVGMAQFIRVKGETVVQDN